MFKSVDSKQAASMSAEKLATECRRYSADCLDEGYANFLAIKAQGFALEVRIDGELVKDVVTADEVRGLVICNVRPLAIGEDGELVSSERRGAVRVALVPL